MPPLDFSLPFGGFRQSAPARAAGRDNHFGLLRIVFAALVVVSPLTLPDDGFVSLKNTN